ncbi:MAG: glycosyl hydrolase [Acidobacteria bacterium]|nr:MAG: glycosyl hydrolase [Acidobacteriota bacterium]
MPRTVRFSLILTVSALCFSGALSLNLAARQAAPAGATAIDPIIWSSLKWRSIGPDRGGRSIAISGVKGRPNEGYFGAVGGGLWKTTDKGETWTPVTDGQIHSSSVGAVAVSQSNPDIVWIGMGETCIRGNIMSGDGLYRSTDAGKTWTHMGFEDSPAISKIRIHPTNPDILYVAAFGKLSAPSEKRGVYKSTDGGKTWKRTLFRDNKTAAIDISIDPNNPNVMFAAMWEAFRLEYTMSSGGPGSGLFKSTDAGETWTEITRNPGMPAGMIGRIGVAVSGADSNRVYAVVENSDNGGLYSSDNAGATWTLVNSGRNIRQRAFYYTHVTADPHNKDLVYVLNVGTFRSTDGGKTLTSFAGGDSHELWIDPDDSNHVMHASDSGGAVTYTALTPPATWSARDYPTPQYYHVATTRHLPYHVCGAQQDGSTVCVSSATGLAGAPAGRGGGRRGGGPAVPDPYGIGGAEPGYIAPDPKDPDVFFSGGNNGSWLERLNRRTGESREVGPYPMIYSGQPSSALKQRIQWTFPIIFSPVDPKVIYTATQHVWKSTNQGDAWTQLSGDLTRHDPKTMGVSGGPITGDMNGPEVYATVFAIGPGKTDVNVIWAGSDDGLIHVTRDGGKIWTNVTPKDMPDFGRVSIIDGSKFDVGGAYVAVKRPLLDDFSPYIFRTKDWGRTWTKIVNGIAPNDYVHTVREDPTRKGLLYAGTNHGVYVSFNDGDTWQSLQLNLPDTQVSDLVIERNDLAIATHGRGFYILDNIGPLRQAGAAMSGDVVLLKPNNAIRSYSPATVQYILRKPAQNVTIDFIDAKGTVARSLTSTAAPAAPAGGRGAGGGGGRGGGGFAAPLSTATGINSASWDLRYPNATSFPGMIMWGASVTGPLAAPGKYTVKLTVDGQSFTQPLIVERHPLYSATDADLQAQFDFLIQARDKTSEANNAVIQIRAIKAQIADRLSKSNNDAKLKAVADQFSEGLSTVEGDLYQVKNQSGQDPLNFPIKINNRLASVLSMVGNGDGRPTSQAPIILAELSAELKTYTDRLAATLAKDLPAINAELTRLGLAPITK